MGAAELIVIVTRQVPSITIDACAGVAEAVIAPKVAMLRQLAAATRRARGGTRRLLKAVNTTWLSTLQVLP
jgi:hypothetical protein